MRELDEDDVRVRPGRRGTRPRTKIRPQHERAVAAVVEAVDRGRYTCRKAGGGLVTAVKARELGRRGLVVGDRVRLTGDTSGREGTLARVVRADPRSTLLRRTADDADGTERPLVANASQMGVVVAAADPPPRQGFVDRCLVAAYDAGIAPLLIVTKNDLADPASFLRRYDGLEVRTIRIAPGRGIDEIVAALASECTVLIGMSGVGKSTLVNRLIPEADRATGAVNAVTGRGRHTSTSAVMFDLPGGGSIVDTPGLRSFGLRHVSATAVVRAFADLAGGVDQCPRGCSHTETDCALDEWVALGHSSTERLESLRRILTALNSTPDY